MIVLNFYDGPVDGLIEIDSVKYRFVMIADSGKRIRIFALSRVEPDLFDNIVENFALYETPNRPVWILHFNFPDIRTEASMNKIIAAALASDKEIEKVLAMDIYAGSLTAIKNAPNQINLTVNSDIGIMPKLKIDWFDYLGIGNENN